ncbi:protein-arginine deiminase family protein [Planktothrix sp. FACHB-1365]|uniref:protein-arginine deiminase family protein n=1 Tax=Planktothrix sp. FACHB-1365 TaxID=2692855 RepID=UPI001682FA64|nr:protein-arginine deiminase family protein [Planktothrix sp. FACHB-1365]MBD2482137.1 protein-arginine deiminase [Planktothrix sp. FACHB-1365]
MNWMRYIAVALINAFGVVVGIIWVPAPPTFAQSAPTDLDLEYHINDSGLQLQGFETDTRKNPNFETIEITPKSLPELYQLRDRIQAELKKASNPPDINSNLEAWEYQLQLKQYETLVKANRQVETQIKFEETTLETWNQAIKIATEAATFGKQPETHTVKDWETAQQLWVQAIDTLRKIPRESFLSAKAIDKIVEYQGYLAIATYQRALAQQSQKEQPEKPQTISPISTANPQFPGFKLYGDTNRDGIVNEVDEQRPEQWSLSVGPLVLFNNDDDDRSGLPDWREKGVNGAEDEKDLAVVHFKVSQDYNGSELLMSVDETARPYINLFQKTSTGWKPVDLSGITPLEFSSDIILGVEAKQFANQNWSGLINLKAVARKQGIIIATDTISMGVAPWIMSPNTAPVSEVHISDRGDNQTIVQAVKTIVEKTGANVKVTPGATLWMKGTQEIGYVQFPKAEGLEEYPVVLKGNRSTESDDYAQSLMNQNFGWFEVGKPRQLDVFNQWADWYNNLAVTPALPKYPLGRIYYGTADNVSLNPEVLEFLKAQKIQGDPVAIDTSWLMVRHVDEIINFIPSPSGEPLMLIASPGEGIKLLKELEKQGYEGAAINRELSTQTTVRAALNNQLLIQHNQNLQKQKIDPLINQLKKEFNLRTDQIIEIPAIFSYSGYAWWPNLINCVYVNGELLVSNPKGPLIDGRDYTQEDFKRRVAVAGINVDFLEDDYYQELQGNIYTATNTTRLGNEQPFWQDIPTP